MMIQPLSNRSVLPLALLLVLLIGCRAESIDAGGEVAIVGVTIVDVEAGELRPAMTVVTSGDRIVAVGEASAVVVPPGARRIGGDGRFLIPGLWDMHVHVGGQISSRTNLPLYVANGVTGVRIMSGDCDANCSPTLENVRDWRSQIEARAIAGPRMVASSRLFDGPGAMYEGSYEISDPDDARSKVREAHAHGVDFLKIYEDLPRDVYFAVMDEARRVGLDAVGHVPHGMTAAEASDAGQKSIEHIDWTELLACSSQHTKAERARAAYLKSPARETTQAYRRALIESFDASACAPLFDLLKRNGTWLVPTLVYHRARSRPEAAAAATAERMAYLPPGVEASWRAAGIGADAGTGPLMPSFFSVQLQYVGAAHRAGAGLLAGTDPWNLHVFAGFGLHDELELFVEAGLSPLDALRTATSAPAAFLGRAHELGAIKPGYLADLVLLDADPTERITNTRRISAVMANGRLLDRAALDELLDDISSVRTDPALDVPAPVARLAWVDRQGNVAPTPGESGDYSNPSLSPDGRRAAVVAMSANGSRHIWVIDLVSGTRNRLTWQGTRNFLPVWSPDGDWIYFASDRAGDPDVWKKRSDQTGDAELVYGSAGPQVPGAISADGRWLALDGQFKDLRGRVLALLPLLGGDLEVLTDGPEADEWAPRFSPDGRFIAFHIFEGPAAHAYVQELATGARWRISDDDAGGAAPRWTQGGAEIVFRSGGHPVAVAVAFGQEPSFSAPRQLFEMPPRTRGGWDVTPDGRRFLMVQTVRESR